MTKTMTNKNLAACRTTLLACVWHSTGDPRMPLACVWTQADPAKLCPNSASSSSDEAGGLRQCA
jgi:hypothetical protein